MKTKELFERTKLAFKILTTKDGNLVRYAQDELRESLSKPKDDIDRWYADELINSVRVFCLSGHSGFSASVSVSALQKLLSFRPLSPLTGDEDEWGEIFDTETNCQQNKRDGRVFKNDARGAYFLDQYVFVEPDGVSYTSKHSFCNIEFPFTPKSHTINVGYNATEEEQKEAIEKFETSRTIK